MPLRSRSMQPSTSSRILVRVDSFSESQMRGRLYSPFLGKGTGFSDFVDMVNKMDHMFDRIGFPQASMEYRSFRGSALPKNGDLDSQMDDTALDETGENLFVVHVQMRQNADWQGMVTTAGHPAGRPFKSTMELLKMIDEEINV